MRIHLWLPLLAAAALTGPVHAGPLTFAEALDRAAADAPSLKAAGLQAQAARAASRAAGALPDPKLGLSVENYPISGPVAGRPDLEEMTMGRVALMQDVPNRASRRAAVGEARAEISEAEARQAVEARKVKVAAASAWIDLAFAERRLAALDALLEILNPLWDAQPSAVASGQARPGQVATRAQMRAGFEDRRSELAAALGRARAELTRWTGEPAPAAAGPPPRYDVDPAALRAALGANPSLLVSRSAIARAEAQLETARAARRPDWSWEVAYARRHPAFGDMVSAGVTVSLPLFANRRQEPIIAARGAEAARAAAEREDVRRMLEAQLESDLADHLMHHELWMRTVNTVVPAAQQRADLETESYAAGRASLSEVVEAMSALAEAKLAALDREAAATRDAARIVLTWENGR